MVLDDDHLFIRGGEPILVAPDFAEIPFDPLFAQVVNSSAAFGLALALDPLSPSDEHGLSGSEINAAAIEGRIFRIPYGHSKD